MVRDREREIDRERDVYTVRETLIIQYLEEEK